MREAEAKQAALMMPLTQLPVRPGLEVCTLHLVSVHSGFALSELVCGGFTPLGSLRQDAQPERHLIGLVAKDLKINNKMDKPPETESSVIKFDQPESTLLAKLFS